jgi:hypothetical protein
VAKAGPGATKFDPPVTAVQPSTIGDTYDKPWIAISQKGTVMISFSRSDSMTYSNVVVVTSPDGAKWKEVKLPGYTTRALPTVCASRTSPRVYAAWIEADMTTEKIAAQWSDDEGVTWSKQVTVSGTDKVGYDPGSCVADGNDVWFTYLVGAAATGTTDFPQMKQVRVAHSTDGGTKYLPAVDAHDPVSAKLFLHPTVALEGDGTLDVFYYGGLKSADTNAAFYSSRSKDQGVTFGEYAVEHSPLNLDLSRQDTQWLGDYAGVARREGRMHFAYVDNTGSLAHVSYRGIDVAK